MACDDICLEESYGIQYQRGELSRKSWFVFKNLFQAQDWSILKSSDGVRRSAEMNKELLTKLKHKKKEHKQGKQGYMT